MAANLCKLASYLCFLWVVWTAAGSYHVSLGLPDEELTGLTLAVAAGENYAAGTKLDDQVLKSLRTPTPGAPQPKSVQVREFAWQRWTGRWQFTASSLFMLGFALAGPLFQNVGRGGKESVARQNSEEMQKLLLDFSRQIAQLTRGEPSPVGPEHLDKLSELTSRCHDAIQNLKEPLMAELGLRRMVGFLVEYAVLERSLNRAWSAVTDGYPAEGYSSLKSAQSSLDSCMAYFR